MKKAVVHLDFSFFLCLASKLEPEATPDEVRICPMNARVVARVELSCFKEKFL